MTPDPRVHAPGWSKRSNASTPLKCVSTFLLWKQLKKIVGQTWLNLVTLTCGSWCQDLHGPVTLPYILTTIWCMNILVRDYESVQPQDKFRSLWSLFHGPLILSYLLKTIWCMNIILCDYESVWPDVWPQNKCSSLWPIFHGRVILPLSWRLFDVRTSYFWDYESVWSDLKINVGLCDLYFTVGWFCLIFPRLFDWWVSYFQKMRQYYPNFDLKLNISQHDLYFMVFYLEDCLMFEHHSLGLWVGMTRHLT